MFKVHSESYLKPNLFVLNVRKGFSQNSREHIDQITKVTTTHYEYINAEGKTTLALFILFLKTLMFMALTLWKS